MNILFMNSKKSKTSHPHKLLLKLTDKIKLKKVINMLLYQILAYTIHCKIKKSSKNNKFEKKSPTWNEESELSDRSYSVSDFQDCFQYILRTW